MFKKISLRLRLTILSVLLLTICCVSLTAILQFSAAQMATVIEATLIAPANELSKDIKSVPATKVKPIALSSSESARMAKTGFLYESTFYMIIIVLVGGGLTYYISGKALQPLQALSSQMKNRTVHNLAEYSAVPESHDEIADLTISFNEMSKKMNDAFAMQKRFSQSAAHELRTPLTVLKTKVDVFKKKKEHNAEEYDKLLSVISNQTDRLACLVTDLLNLTNMDGIESGKAISIKALIGDVSEELHFLTKGKNITLSISGEEGIIVGNQNLLHRAFYNLIENAIKYNIENGKVYIEIKSQEEFCNIKIRDTGIGIPLEMRELVFEPFFRVDKSRSREMGGSGLGLPTVKSIIDEQGGSITVLENPEGGTIFEINI